MESLKRHVRNLHEERASWGSGHAVASVQQPVQPALVKYDSCRELSIVEISNSL